MNLREAARAVLDRWDSPAWEWAKHGPTADLMADLRAALNTQQTHSTDCWRWHHECAIAKIQIMRTPLTEQQLDELLASDKWAGFTELARAVERWHHIGDSPCAS